MVQSAERLWMIRLVVGLRDLSSWQYNGLVNDWSHLFEFRFTNQSYRLVAFTLSKNKRTKFLIADRESKLNGARSRKEKSCTLKSLRTEKMGLHRAYFKNRVCEQRNGKPV
jgi:hypothetical protein